MVTGAYKTHGKAIHEIVPALPCSIAFVILAGCILQVQILSTGIRSAAEFRKPSSRISLRDRESITKNEGLWRVSSLLIVAVIAEQMDTSTVPPFHPGYLLYNS